MLSLQDKTNLSLLGTAGTVSDPLGLTPPKADNRKRFLRFSLSQKHDALLPLEHVIEVMQLPRESILPVPDMPRCILGICSWQGETLWLVDFNYLVGYKSLYQQAPLTQISSAVVVRHNGITLGLVVEKVIDIDLLDDSTMHMDAGLCPPELEPFVVGHCLQQNGILLSASAVVNASQLHAHSVHP